jgi:plastocyanin
MLRMRAPTHRHGRVLTVLAAAFLMMLAGAAAAGSETPTIEARSSIAWKPPSVTINPGGEVKIVNLNMGTHGVEWKTGPATPSCTSGVPVGNTPAASGSNWSGSCTFAKAGTYEFWCTVHGSAMKAVVTVTSAGPVPAIRKLAPKKGPAAGGTVVTIMGSGFTGASAVMFGAVPAASFSVISDTQISATSPAEPKSTVDVSVTTPGGTSGSVKGDRFKFVKHK